MIPYKKVFPLQKYNYCFQREKADGLGLLKKWKESQEPKTEARKSFTWEM